VEVTACESYLWNEVLFTESGTYSANFTDVNGCDSTATLVLTINKSTESTVEVTACESYLWNEVLFTESGTYSANFTDVKGCDSTATLVLTINKSTESTMEVTACGSYLWNDAEYTESGTYSANFTNANGCDSVAKLILTIQEMTEVVKKVTACGSYTWNDFEYLETGLYSHTISRALGCDTIEILDLTIISISEQLIAETGCDSVTVNGITYSENGTFTQTLVSHNGCDSILTINVTITNCNPEMNLEDDRGFTEFNSGITIQVKENDNGVTEGSVVSAPATSDAGGTITVNEDGSITYTPAEDYVGEDKFVYTVTTPDGRTGIATVTITVNPPSEMIITAVPDEFEILNTEIAVGNIIGNDINPVGELITNTAPTVEPLNGNVVIHSDGTFEYTPNAGFTGIDSFNYQICNSILPTVCSETTVTIYVVEEQEGDDGFFSVCDLFIPDGFSPNGDNINDYFEITYYSNEGDCSAFGDLHPDANVKIYNRWGNLVYEKDGFGNVDRWGSDLAWWDGSSTSGWTVGKDKMTPGTYFYILDFNDGVNEPVSGSVFLNR
jgi:predicted RNase H-like HicB family nuclease